MNYIFAKVFNILLTKIASVSYLINIKIKTGLQNCNYTLRL